MTLCLIPMDRRAPPPPGAPPPAPPPPPRRAPAPGAALLTFDDSTRGFYDEAYPLLERYRVPAALFVDPDEIGRTGADPPRIDAEDLRAIDRGGLVSVGALLPAPVGPGAPPDP